MKVTIRNNFTKKSIEVDTSKPLTAKKIRYWRRKLHDPFCQSGDILGGRGTQDDPEAYYRLAAQAMAVMTHAKTKL